MNSYQVIGLMSGTSLDGVDLAFCTFQKDEEGWTYDIHNTKTYPYPQKWLDILTNIHELDDSVVREVDTELGLFYSQLIENFTNDHRIIPDFISSHGHTAYHRPKDGVTLQIGSGEVMANRLKMPVINDFRKKDVKMGGQGAPLVPIGDKLLFNNYDICLNLGGFSNLSFDQGEDRLAYDICPVNMALNEVAMITGVPFDKDGNLAKAGDIHERVLQSLEKIPFYSMIGPRSLSREWYSQEFQSKMYAKKIPPIDLLATLTEHIALRISETLNSLDGNSVLITGGGAFNTFLMDRMQSLCSKDLHIPDQKLVSFKEALIFGLLGVLRIRNDVNILSSVTGSSQDHCSGVIHKP